MKLGINILFLPLLTCAAILQSAARQIPESSSLRERIIGEWNDAKHEDMKKRVHAMWLNEARSIFFNEEYSTAHKLDQIDGISKYVAEKDKQELKLMRSGLIYQHAADAKREVLAARNDQVLYSAAAKISCAFGDGEHKKDLVRELANRSVTPHMREAILSKAPDQSPDTVTVLPSRMVTPSPANFRDDSDLK